MYKVILVKSSFKKSSLTRFKIPMLRPNLCDAYIVVKKATYHLAAAGNKNDKAEKVVVFKNNVLFRKCISKINNTEDLDNRQCTRS